MTSKIFYKCECHKEYYYCRPFDTHREAFHSYSRTSSFVVTVDKRWPKCMRALVVRWKLNTSKYVIVE